MPEPPVDLRLSQQTSDKIVLTWLPVTLSVDGYSNGYKVSGYKIYVNGVYCTETASACVDSTEISAEKLRNLVKRNGITRMRFVVRTLSIVGESVDSNFVDIESGIIGAEPSKINFIDTKEASCTKDPAAFNLSNLENDFLPDNTKVVSTSNKKVFNNEVSCPNEDNMKQKTIASRDACTPQNFVAEKGGKAEGSEDVKGVSTVTEGIPSTTEGQRNHVEIVADTSRTTPSAVDAPAMQGRRAPIVTRYEEIGSTETESTETKSQETEEEFIERFEQVQVCGVIQCYFT